MISVQNLRQRLNGNKRTGSLLFLSLLILSCSSSLKSQKIIEDSSIVQSETDTVVTQIRKKDKKLPKDTIQLQNAYNIALILPLEVDSVDFRKNNVELYPYSSMSLDWYEGVSLALDSLKKAGLNIYLHIFDSKYSPNALEQLVHHPSFSSMDYLIGGIHKTDIFKLSTFAKEQQIPFISPLSPDTLSPKFNEYFMMLSSSIKSHCHTMTQYIVQKHQYSNVLILQNETLNAQEKEFARYFSQQLKKDNKRMLNIIKINELSKSFPDTLELIEKLLITEKNIVFIPSLDESYVYLVVGVLKKLIPEYDITVMGLPVWLRFESIRIDLFEDLNLHLTNSYHFTNNKRTQYFRNLYRKKFMAEPSKFAYLGYDAFQYIGKLLLHYGRSYQHGIGEVSQKGMCTSIKVSPILSPEKQVIRYENCTPHLLKFENFDIIAVNKPPF